MKERMIHQLVGALDERDEYQRKEIHRELAFSGVLLWYLSMGLMVAMIIADAARQTFTLYPILLFVMNMVYAGYVTVSVKRRQLDESDTVTWEEYESKKQKLRHSSVKGGGVWMLFMLIMMEYVLPVLGGGEAALTAVSFLIWGVAAVVFAGLLYLYAVSRLNKPQEEDDEQA